MKTLKLSIIATLALLVVSLNSFAQVKELPITTASQEALKNFLSGREKTENFQNVVATSLFDKAIELDPNFALAYLYRSFSRGGYNMYKKNLEKAVSLLDKVSEGEKYYIMYFKSGMEGNSAKMKECLDKLLQMFPSDKRVNNLAGNYYYSINDYTKALSFYSKSFEIDGKYGPSINMIGYCNIELKNYTEAEKAFKTYIELVPNIGAAYDSYAELLLKMGKYDESILQYKKSHDLSPEFISPVVGLANNYTFKGDFESARNYLDDFYQNAPNASGKLGCLFWKAVTYVHEGNIAKALSTFDEYRTLAEKENLVPNIINSYINQGLILSENGKPMEGLASYQKAIELTKNPIFSDKEKDNYLMNFLMWESFFLAENNDLDKASLKIDEAQKKAEERKNSYEINSVNLIRGYIEFKKGNYNNAINLFKADEENGDPYFWYTEASAYRKIGDNENAKRLLEKVASFNRNSLNYSFVRGHALAELK